MSQELANQLIICIQRVRLALPGLKKGTDNEIDNLSD